MKWIISFCLLLSSCQTMPTTSGIPDDKDLAFPREVYKQKITILIKKEDKKMSFDGAIKKNSEVFSLFAFSSMGIRIFTLKDDYKNIEFVSHVQALEDKKEFILKLYPVIKKIFTLKTTDADFQKRQFVYQLEQPIGDVEVKINEKATEISVSKDKYFEFNIENL